MGVGRDIIALELLIQAWALSYTKRVIPRSGVAGTQATH
jgi:hypothetical protein